MARIEGKYDNIIEVPADGKCPRWYERVGDMCVLQPEIVKGEDIEEVEIAPPNIDDIHIISIRLKKPYKTTMYFEGKEA